MRYAFHATLLSELLHPLLDGPIRGLCIVHLRHITSLPLDGCVDLARILHVQSVSLCATKSQDTVAPRDCSNSDRIQKTRCCLNSRHKNQDQAMHAASRSGQFGAYDCDFYDQFEIICHATAFTHLAPWFSLCIRQILITCAPRNKHRYLRGFGETAKFHIQS
jgi:hypothetical protein